MQQINKITRPFPEILLPCYFGKPWTCPGMPDQTQQILQDLTKLPWISNYIQKKNIIPQIVFEILKFKKSCNLICGEHFGLKLEKQIFPRHTVFTKSYTQLWGII